MSAGRCRREGALPARALPEHIGREVRIAGYLVTVKETGKRQRGPHAVRLLRGP